MAPSISLALVLHNHQPVGNFGWVFEDVYRAAYEPMLAALERHPTVRVGLHYSGSLLDWLGENHPDFLGRVRTLVARDQVEILGGGYYEPVLISLPERDRAAQLERMTAKVERLFGSRPIGAWLAERVWEPSLPSTLADAGYRWTVLDDNHLRAASVAEEAMWGTYTTDDQGRTLTIFGTEQGLRNRIPFRPVDELIDYLREHATADGLRLGTMGDDGEKFGAWPGTFEHCWGPERWVDRCFDALEANADWITTVCPSDWCRRVPPLGRVYVPTASYVEMTQWALPPNEANVFARALEAARREGRPEARFLRGGMWRNFAARYREVGDLHKQMLRTSEKVEAMPDGPARELAREHLFQGQSNDCYWHGLFGGIYIVHMRMATLAHLIAAEDIAEGGASAQRVAERADFDLDGLDEVLLRSPGQTLLVDVAEGAGIGSWDLPATHVALASVLRRRREAYHETLLEHEHALSVGAPAGGTGTPTSIHDLLLVKEPGLAARLVYDRHERRSGLVHLLPVDGSGQGPTPNDLAAVRYAELGDLVDGAYVIERLEDRELRVRRDGQLETPAGRSPLGVIKRITAGGGRLDPTLSLEVTIRNEGREGISCELAVEWNINLMGGGGNPAAYYEWLPGDEAVADAPGGTPVSAAHDAPGDLAHAERIVFGNRDAGVRIEALPSPQARITWFPVETISNSEAGFERVYQGSALLFRWPLQLGPGEQGTWGLSLRVRQEASGTPDGDEP